MNVNVRFHLLGGAVVLAAGLVVSIVTSTIVASRAYEARGRMAVRTTNEINVRGSARVRVRSDVGRWAIEVKGESATLADAYTALASATQKVQAFLKDHKFSDDEVSPGAIDTVPSYRLDAKGNRTSDIERYTLERTILVCSADVDRLAAVCGEVTELLKDGVQVLSRPPAYYYTKAQDLKVRILGEATADARSRAEEIATKSGCRVSQVRAAHMGVIQITKPDSTDVSSEGIYDTTSIAKDVSVVVSATFTVDG